MSERFRAQWQLARNEIDVPWSTRRDRLLRLRALLKENREGLATAIGADFGNRARQETQLLELLPCLEAIHHALAHGSRWMKPARRATGRWFRPGQARLVPQPVGTVGIVSPWNYPLYLTVGPLVCALAAGNRVMAKLSEYTPRFGALFAATAAKYFAQEEVAVVNGDVQLAQAFVALPFDHLLFTGSTAVGYAVMRAAAQNLTPVTLELGGKSPAIIGPTADFERAVERIMAGKLLNAGQTCIAPDYVLLNIDAQDRFVAQARAYVAAAYPGLGGSGAAPSDYTSIVAERHLLRLKRLIEEAVAAGARRVPLTADAAPPGSRVMPPVILTDVPPTATIMREEIFGPVLPLVGYRSLDEAINYVNARPRPLALYVFETDRKAVDTVLARTVAGGVTVNDTLMHIAQDDLPFGGIGPSGMGAYHGRAGFETFSHMKPVFHQSSLNATRFFKPPYGKRFDTLLRILTR